MDKADKISGIILIIGFIGFIVLFLGLTVFKPRDVLVKETDEYFYYKQYTLFGLDSTCCKYHKPMDYEGIVSDKSKSSHFVGVAGKGGHCTTTYKTTVSYDGRTYTIRGSGVYHNYEKGDEVIVTETFYPRHVIDFRHK